MSEPAPPDVTFRAPRTNLWLESRYRKLRRGLPQTVFYCPLCKGDRRRSKGCQQCGGFGKLTKESVQELIGRRILPQMQAKGGSFHGAGREDVDVLMLGRGRPFVRLGGDRREPDQGTEPLLDPRPGGRGIGGGWERCDRHGEHPRAALIRDPSTGSGNGG